MHTALRERAAEALFEANRTRQPIPPLVETYEDIDVTDAYEIQLLTVKKWLADGRIVKGHKVGLSSAAMQRQMGVNQPDYGHLFADQFYLENMPIPLDEHIQPRLEPEIAFVLRKDLAGPYVTLPDAIDAVAYVLPSLEVVDSRIQDWRIGIVDTIADNASGGGVILGGPPRRLEGLDLRLVGCTMYRNGRIVGTGAGGAVLGSPLNSLVWLANTLGRFGVTLEAGNVILPGSVMRAIDIAPGDRVTAQFGGLGSVTAVFAGNEGAAA
ncbi:2-keto-4-pentenoate hydratase [Raineyella antarctica]|uniref:2-keto-4-pentenoate hydratase n=1 Tax=Raineyella antarctica TaxID=1577474 RepID=A0A1G6GI53_9ACTN|nr:2-keto-4-pentenoate hydratase [Raineyella antarctica]SDB81630.1 2-keto-4-pentenoate hydratase [Raineyella antarctica]